ncbi:MAG: hypothetical protein ACFFG0_03665 [Candidatus Thorarchaeota archaeon]
MKAIKDAKWDIDIKNINGKTYFWGASTKEIVGLDIFFEGCKFIGLETFETKKGAIDNWKKFAKLNGIENYEIKEE